MGWPWVGYVGSFWIGYCSELDTQVCCLLICCLERYPVGRIAQTHSVAFNGPRTESALYISLTFAFSNTQFSTHIISTYIASQCSQWLVVANRFPTHPKYIIGRHLDKHLRTCAVLPSSPRPPNDPAVSMLHMQPQPERHRCGLCPVPTIT